MKTIRLGLVSVLAVVMVVMLAPCQAYKATVSVGTKGPVQVPEKDDPSAPPKFQVTSADRAFVVPAMVVPPALVKGPHAAKVKDAVNYLQEGIRKITGRELTITNTTDLRRGIVLTTIDQVSPELGNDSKVIEALKDDGTDVYNAKEAFYIRSEPERLLIIANSAEGLSGAVAELLESVGYEVLGMGPNWIHVPHHLRDSLAFRIERAGRPSYYFRRLVPSSGQDYGVGTIRKMGGKELLKSPDEYVDESYTRWQIGFRTMGQSMPSFPGHALQGFHRSVVAKMKETKQTDGFLLKNTKLATQKSRPKASKKNTGQLWINTDNNKVLLSDGKDWKERNLAQIGVNLDLSVPLVRGVIFDAMKKRSETFFQKNPDEIFVFGTDPEDGGGYASLAEMLRNPNWYPSYLKKKGIPFGKPYVLHGYRGLNQPREIWDANAPADTVFGFNNWLLHEYDKWLDSLPASEQVTATGKSKKSQIRCSLFSYNYHDVPPNFNLDPRIRVMIAGYPKYRGRGKWKKFQSQQDIAKAFQIMLPKEPSGDYRIISLAIYWDSSVEMLAPLWDASPQAIAIDLGKTFSAGIKALSYEVDFNFGRFGLGYYLISKMLWNANLSVQELNALRDRWLQRAYGSGWKTMKQYYDFLLLKNFTVNGTRTWAQAIRYIEQADKQIDAGKEPEAQRRLDDLKQYWYYAYLLDSTKVNSKDPEMREFAWKGQMSYMNAMHAIARRIYAQGGVNGMAKALGPEITDGPAHYSHAETQVWWKKILDRWPFVPVTMFSDITLANGTKGKDVDLNDLVVVKEFGNVPATQGFYYNSGYMKEPKFVQVATTSEKEIGFKLFWPADPTGKDGYYTAKDLVYGVERWDSAKGAWAPWIDKTTTRQSSVEVPDTKKKDRKFHLVEVRLQVPTEGSYRFEIGRGGNLSYLTDLSYDMSTRQFSRSRPFTFSSNSWGHTQNATYIYIPKGTPSLDIEVADSYHSKSVTLYKGVSPISTLLSRKVDISDRKTHRIRLKPEETGTIATIYGIGFAFPYLYSVPMYWAKAPSQLVIPRAVAKADGLTIVP
jgi:hypothetical protein